MHIRAPEHTKPASRFQRLFGRTHKWAGSECGRGFSSWVVRPRTTSPGGSGKPRLADGLTIRHRQSCGKGISPPKLALFCTAALSSAPTGRKLALFRTAGPPPSGRVGRAHQSLACSDAVRRFCGEAIPRLRGGKLWPCLVFQGRSRPRHGPHGHTTNKFGRTNWLCFSQTHNPCFLP